MRGTRAWAFCVSFPETLDILYESVKSNKYKGLLEQYDVFSDYAWLVPDQAQEGDYIIYIVTPGNLWHINRLIDELSSHPEEWSVDDFEELLLILEAAQFEYSDFDGKLLFISPIEKVDDETDNNWHRRYASFSEVIVNWEDFRSYDNNIVQAERGMKYLPLTYSQTLEIISSAYSRNEENEVLFKLNEGISDPVASDYGNQIQAFVVNNAFNKSLCEIIQDIECRGFLTLDVLLQEKEVIWTAPRWCKPGDIAFFMLSKTSSAIISALTTEYNKSKEEFSVREKRIIEEALQHGRELYKRYGGCIYAFARVNGKVSYERQDPDTLSHWKSPIYVHMENMTILEKPISIEDFREFLTISRQRTITPVLGDAFDRLRDLIINDNDVPDFFKTLKATPMPLQNVNNENWIAYGMEYRRRFFLEEAFRKYYVDYLLRELGDKKTFYRECSCYKSKGNPPRVDNIIVFLGKYLPVEIKLSIYNEVNLETQVHQYCQLTHVVLGKGKTIDHPLEQMYSMKVLIIDTENIYVYDGIKGDIQTVFNLDQLTDMTKIKDLRNAIASML